MMQEKPPAAPKPTTASIQAEIDRRMFAQTPIHIIERYLDSFASDGSLTFPVPQHILEAMALRLMMFTQAGSALESLDDAFGGTILRQRQRRATANRQFDVAFLVEVEMRKLRKVPRSVRIDTPYKLACEIVAKELGLAPDTIEGLYKEGKKKRQRKAG